MGTEVQVEIILKEESERKKAEEALKKAQKIFEEQEKIFSRFNPKSELSQINQNLGKKIAISRSMKEVLALCLKFNRIMKGYFDPRVMDVLEKIGYDRDFQTHDLNDPKKNFSSLEISKNELVDDLKLDFADDTVLVSRRIDTTGIAKGYTVDKVVSYLKSEGWENFLVDAGGDMSAFGNGENERGWIIGVEGLENDSVKIRLKDEGIATSGISRKRWLQGKKKVHHLINPKKPEEFSHDLKTVTVVAEKTVEADGRAKSLFLMGREEGLEFANENNIKCLFLDYKNNVYVSNEFKKNLA